MSIEAMKLALEALEQSQTKAPFGVDGVVYSKGVKIHEAAITALRERLAHCDRCGKKLGGEGDIHTCTPDPIGDAQDRLIAELAAQPAQQEPTEYLYRVDVSRMKEGECTKYDHPIYFYSKADANNYCWAINQAPQQRTIVVAESHAIKIATPPAQPAQQEPEYWNVIDPAGNIVASETDAIRGWARIAGSYKPTVEGLLGFHDQGWRVLPKVTPPEAAQQESVGNVEALRHSANEWADMAANGLQWVRNIAEGISEAQEALSDLEANLVHCREVNDRREVQAFVTITPPAQPAQRTEQEPVALRDALAASLTSVYVCGRMWDAWQVGTMTEDDFYPASECVELLNELVQAVTSATPPAAEHSKLAAWMIQFGFATGHGDTMDQLLEELRWQVRESEREACAKVCDELHPGLSTKRAAEIIRARGKA